MARVEAGSAAPQGGARAVTQVLDAPGAARLVISGDDSFILTAEYIRLGQDLMLRGPDGREVLVRDYFLTDSPPALWSEQGARVTGDVASRLAGPEAPGQYAQAAPGTGATPIGRIELIEGQVTATRADGSVVTLQKDTPVYQGDVVQTGAGGKLGIVFVDRTTLSIAENGRLVLTELVYNPGGRGSSVFTLLQGVFIYVTGEIGRLFPDAVAINTPVATLGVRGTEILFVNSGPNQPWTFQFLFGSGFARNGTGQVDIGTGEATTGFGFNQPFTPPQTGNLLQTNPTAESLEQSVHQPLSGQFGLPGAHRGGSGPGGQQQPGSQPGQENQQQNQEGQPDQQGEQQAGGGGEPMPEQIAAGLSDIAPGAGPGPDGPPSVPGDANPPGVASGSVLGSGTNPPDPLPPPPPPQSPPSSNPGPGTGGQNSSGSNPPAGGDDRPPQIVLPPPPPGNESPVAQADSYATQADAPIVRDTLDLGLLGNDSDPDSPSLTVTAVEGDAANIGQPIDLAQGGKVTVHTDGTFSFDPDGDFDNLGSGQFAETRFTYTVSDGAGGTATATATITVAGATGQGGGDILIGTAGDDVLTGSDDDDHAEGLDGNDILIGGRGVDTLLGGAGSDVFVHDRGDGDDQIDGGADDDILQIYGDLSGSNRWTVERQQANSGVVARVSQTNLALGAATLAVAGVEMLQFVGGDGSDGLIVGDLTGTSISQNTIFFNGEVGNDVLVADGTDRSIYAVGGSGDDRFAAGAGADLLSGDAGRDHLSGGAGADTITGGAADDILLGGAGDDMLTGDANDDILMGGAGNDTLHGGAGIDRASYIQAESGVTVDLATGIATGEGTDTLIDIEQVAGSDQDDVLIGSALANRLVGRAGDDRIRGGGGDDRLQGGAGFDIADYADATGSVTADVAAGTVSGGGLGTDSLRNFERIAGGDFADLFIDGPSGPTAAMNGAVHQFEGRGGADRILGIGTTGISYAEAANGVAVDLGLGTAADIGGASAGADRFSDVSRVIGSRFADTLVGSATGYNEFRPMGGADTVVGNGGTDRVSYAASVATVDVDLQAGKAADDGFGATDTLVDIEQVEGSAFADALRGDAADNVLIGGAGDDLLAGRGGSDSLFGGDGFDRVSYSARSAAVNIDMGAGTVQELDSVGGAASTDSLNGVEMVIGTAFDDEYRGGSTPGAAVAANRFRGGGGDDLIFGDGNTEVDYGDATSGVTVDLSPGGTASGGGVGTDSFDAGSAAIRGVRGSAFDDMLLGNLRSGGNRLLGGAGTDTLDGGGGGDDEADYVTSTSGVHVNLGATDVAANGSHPAIAAGTAFDGFATANAPYGSVDTLIGIQRVRGSRFDDVIVGSASAANRFEGLEGNDFFDGGAGSSGNEIVYSDNIDFVAPRGVTVDLAAGTAIDNVGDLDSFVNIQNVTGSDLADTIRGDAAANMLRGGEGNDLLVGRAGNDALDGGADFDIADYSEATGSIAVDLSAGTVAGDSVGTDSLTRIEKVVGTAFADSFVVGGGVNGNSGAFNVFEGGGGDDSIAGNGNTTLDFSQATNAVFVSFTGIGQGTAAGDASVGTDSFTGVNGIRGTDYADTFFGGAGDETFRGRSGADTINGGAGIDTADYGFAPGAVDVDLELAMASEDGYGFADTLHGIENLNGTEFSDVLRGSAAANVLRGGTGDDTLDGRDGNDALYGEDGDDLLSGDQGDDLLDGGGGSDVADYSSATAHVTVNLANGTASGAASGNDTLTGIEGILGSAFDDDLIGDGGANHLNGGAGADTLTGGAGSDYLVGGAGTDAFIFGAPSHGTFIAANELRGPSRVGDMLADFTSGSDTLYFDITAFTLVSGQINETDNFSVIGAAYDGTNAGQNAQFNAKHGTFVFSTADSTLYYDGNGSDDGYTVVATVQSGGQVAAGDITMYSGA